VLDVISVALVILGAVVLYLFVMALEKI